MPLALALAILVPASLMLYALAAVTGSDVPLYLAVLAPVALWIMYRLRRKLG